LIQKKLLIISYTFPPTKGIGGRRWVKFAKYLNRENIDISIITSKNNIDDQSQWIADLKNIETKIEKIDFNYPSILKLRTLSFFQKVVYHFTLFYVKLIDKGNYYDKSIFVKKNLVEIVEKKIIEGYNNVLISCGPFRFTYYLIGLKKKFPNVNFIVDYRDPWTNNKTSFGYNFLPKKRLEFEINCEKYVLKNADIILTVSNGFLNYWKLLCPNLNINKVIELTNGYDTDDYGKIFNVSRQDEFIKFVFAGNLYENTEKYFKQFCEKLKDFKVKNPEIYKTLSFDFYGIIPHSFYNYSKFIDCINFHGQVSNQLSVQKIAESNFAILFLTDDLNYSFSTKFYEYVSQNKPIIVFSKRGLTGQFIEENELGYSCFSDEIDMKFDYIIDQHLKNKFLVPKIDTNIYEIKNLTKNLIDKVIK
jgi:hypothetical protein